MVRDMTVEFILTSTELLSEQRTATRENIQRKQARTDAEREEEAEEAMTDR